jgi:hypothetical protein
MIYLSKKPMVEAIQQFVAEGGQIEVKIDHLGQYVGFKSKLDPNLDWVMAMVSIKERRFRELASQKTREAQAQAFNHQHELNDPNCKLCIVHEVMIN